MAELINQIESLAQTINKFIDRSSHLHSPSQPFESFIRRNRVLAAAPTCARYACINNIANVEIIQPKLRRLLQPRVEGGGPCVNNFSTRR